MVRRPFVIAWRMSGWSLGWAARVIAMVLGDIGGSGFSTSLVGRGVGDSAGKALDILMEALKDIWAGW
jgi:hypothetical protein